jgi:hypothetical protein
MVAVDLAILPSITAIIHGATDRRYQCKLIPYRTIVGSTSTDGAMTSCTYFLADDQEATASHASADRPVQSRFSR